MPDHRHLIIIAALGPWAATHATADLMDPAPVDLGPINLVPTLGISHVYDDNFYRQSGGSGETFNLQILDLDLTAIALDGPHEYRAIYKGQAGFVDESSDDDYYDQTARLNGRWEMTARHRLELDGAYEELHDRRGTGYFQGDQAVNIDEPARYRRESALARYTFGSDSSKGQLRFELNAANKEYLNFRELTEDSDRVNVNGLTTFLMRITGSLRWLLEAGYGEVNYQNDPAAQNGVEDTLDSQLTQYLTGITWDITGQTTGTLKAGYLTKDFSDGDREDFSGSSWSGNIDWWPRSYSRVSFSTARYPEETTSTGDFVDTADWRVRWEHQWNKRIQSSVGALQRKENYEDSINGRDDDTVEYSLSVDYAIRRWLLVGIFYDHEKRDSNLEQFTFTREVAGLTLNMSL